MTEDPNIVAEMNSLLRRKVKTIPVEGRDCKIREMTMAEGEQLIENLLELTAYEKEVMDFAKEFDAEKDAKYQDRLLRLVKSLLFEEDDEFIRNLTDSVIQGIIAEQAAFNGIRYVKKMNARLNPPMAKV